MTCLDIEPRSASGLSPPGSRKSSSIARRFRTALACVLLLWVVGAAGATALARESLDEFPHSTLQIASSRGVQHFSIWVADTMAREEQGLMFVRALQPDQGMLFPEAQPQVMTMWMKNTLIPLDMLFINASGHIVYIRRNATPESEALISTPTPTPVKAVLELPGGECARRGITVGDRVTSPAL